MKKIAIIAATSLFVFSQGVMATGARVDALGGNPAIILDDDTSIDIFPQNIENYNMMRLSHASDATGTNGYAAIIGESGQKWGIYGGQNEETINDFRKHNRELLSIYHSVNQNAAYKAGVTLSSYDSLSATASGGNGTGNRVYATGADVLYGMKSGNTESAIGVSYDKDPYSSAGCTTGLGVPSSPFSVPAAGGGTGNCGQGGTEFRDFHSLTLSYASRQPQQIALFSHSYWDIKVQRLSASYDDNAVANSNIDAKGTSFQGNFWMFNKKGFNNNKDHFYYGLGLGGFIGNGSQDDATTNEKYIRRTILGPNLALGLEKAIKYGVLRFGVNRTFNIYQTDQTETTVGGTTTKVNYNSRGYDGSYAISTGWGLDYENLKIDLVLVAAFWDSGPQMVFDASGGPLASRADIVYMFK